MDNPINPEVKEKYLTFESALPVIDKILSMKRHKWTLKAVIFMDYEDVSQICRIHIWKKWHLYNPELSLEPWVNTIVTNQMLNLRRNVYDKSSRPCLKCAAAEGEDLCNIYEKQCEKCPLFAHWLKNKKHAHDVKLPLSIEQHTNEVFEMPHKEDFDLEKSIISMHERMKSILKPWELKVYVFLYIDGISEEEVVKKMGWRSNEKNVLRAPGYARLAQIKKIIFEKAQEIARDIDF